MNIQDFFYWWLVNTAIVEPNPDKRYYYDKGEKILFGLQGTDTPIGYSNNTNLSEKDLVDFAKQSAKVKCSDPDIILLPRLSYEAKKDFLRNYAMQMENMDVRNTLLAEVESFSFADPFKFKFNFRTVSEDKQTAYDAAIHYNAAREEFICDNVIEKYTPLGVDLNAYENYYLLW